MTLSAFRISQEPYYRPVGAEIALYEAAYRVRLPVMLKGPTGSGKTRFVAAATPADHGGRARGHDRR